MLTKFELKKTKEWIKLLRSGKYKQTRGTLQDEYGYCCLGVACTMSDKSSKDECGILIGAAPTRQNSNPRWITRVHEKFERASSHTTDLTALNDKIDQYSFDEIADCLEAVFIYKVLD